MTIAAVIPSTGRPELKRAVRSVLAQTVAVKPVVVLDRPERAGDVAAQLSGLPHQLILTEGGRGGSAARNIGVASSDADIVAFLDDDDEWLPTKTQKQMALWTSNRTAVVTSRAMLVGRTARVVPEHAFSGAGTMASYLLDRSTLTLRRHYIQSSTLLMTRDLASQVPWNETLGRHQDWGLLIDLDREGTPVITHDEALVRVNQGSAGSISRSTDWRASMKWLEDYAPEANARARGDFICSVALRSALAARDWRASIDLLNSALRMHPHPAAIAVGLSELVRRPRSTLSAVLTAARSRPVVPSVRSECP